MPFGINVALEEFQRRIDENLESLEGVKAIADDILVWGDGDTNEEAIADHDKRLIDLLSTEEYQTQQGEIPAEEDRIAIYGRGTYWQTSQTWPKKAILHPVYVCSNQQRLR